MYKNLDNGGTIAIRGFNFQRAVGVFLLIVNYKQENFYLVPEAEDDFTVFLNDEYYFLQIKSNKLTKSDFKKTITDPCSKTKMSVLEKLINKKCENAVYKIVCNSISKNIKLEENSQKSKIFSKECNVSPLNFDYLEINDNFLEDEIKKIKNTYIYIPPFKTESKYNTIYMLGQLVDLNISVDNYKGRHIIEKLKFLIDKKSEIPLKNINDYKNKKIKNTDINEFFIDYHEIERLKKDYDDLVNSLNYTVDIKIRIRNQYKGFVNLTSTPLYADILETLTYEERLCPQQSFSTEYLEDCCNLIDSIFVTDENELKGAIIYCYIKEVLRFDC